MTLSQPTTKGDTLCRPVEELKTVYRDALRYEKTAELLKIAEAQAAELRSKIEACEENQVVEKNSYERELANVNGQVKTLTDQLTEMENNYEREKRRRKRDRGVAATIILGLTYLIISK